MDERDKWWLQPLMSYGYLTQSSPYPLLNRMKHFYTLVCSVYFYLVYGVHLEFRG